MSKQEIEHFYPKTKQHWRKWLEKNHIRKDAVWLIHYKKNADKPTIGWSDAVDEALCFGWIDSKGVTIDETSFKQYYCKRKPKSTWSKVNKEKLKQLIAANKMTDAGLACIEIAKQNGSWTILDEVEELIIPKDLSKAFRNNKGSEKYFLSLSKSKQKYLLQWIVLARQPQTRQKRIDEIALCASEGKMPKHLQ
jgi:uncharacterized protein YdeI (YjbR/CyaY-like superfamily)